MKRSRSAVGIVVVVRDESRRWEVTAALSAGVVGADVRAAAEPAAVDLSRETDCLVVGPSIDRGAASALRRAYDDGVGVVTIGTGASDGRSGPVVREPVDDGRLVAAVEGAVLSERHPEADGWVVLDDDARIAARGGTAEECVDTARPLDPIVPEDRGALRSAIGRCLGTGSAAATVTVETADGSDCVRIRFDRVTDADGRPVRIYGVFGARPLARCDGPTLRAATRGD